MTTHQDGSWRSGGAISANRRRKWRSRAAGFTSGTLLVAGLAAGISFAAPAGAVPVPAAEGGHATSDHADGVAKPHEFKTPDFYKNRGSKNGAAAAAGDAPPPLANLTYHGGVVMRNVTVYTIFWDPTTKPAGYSGSSFSSTYQSSINQFFRDLGSTPYMNIITQYGDSSGDPVPATLTLGGTWTDVASLPHAGTWTDPIGGNDIADSAKRAKAAHPSWTQSGPSAIYMVYTPKGVIECDGAADPAPGSPNGTPSTQSCFDANDFTGVSGGGTYPLGSTNSAGGTTVIRQGAFCAWHTYFGSKGTGTIFSNQPYAGGPGANCVAGGPNFPNGAEQDLSIGPSSHELFESMSDPYLNAWYNTNLSGENGDQCAYNMGPLEADGTNVVLHGNRYAIQTEWSNGSPHQCVKRYGPLPGLTVTPSNPSFGTLARGTSASQTVTLGNSGPGTVDLLGLQLTSDPNVSVTGFTHPTLAPGQTEGLTVTVTAPSGGTSSTSNTATSTLDSDNTPANTGNPTSTDLTANTLINASYTIGVPQISATPSAVDFGTVPRGTSAFQSVTLKNTGDADLHISNVSISGDPAYTLTAAAPVTVVPGSSTVVGVTFSPSATATSAGPLTGTLSIASDAGLNPTQTVPLTGKVGIPVASLSSTSVDFGNAAVGSPVTKTVTVTNSGTAPLSVTGLPSSGTNAGDFSASGCAAVVAPTASCDLTLRFAPSAGGVRSGTISVVSNGLVSPIPITVKGSAFYLHGSAYGVMVNANGGVAALLPFLFNQHLAPTPSVTAATSGSSVSGSVAHAYDNPYTDVYNLTVGAITTGGTSLGSTTTATTGATNIFDDIFAQGTAASCSATPTGVTGNATITGLRVDGVTYGGLGWPFRPNDYLFTANGGKLVINEQIHNADGTLTINALHLYINNPTYGNSGDVIVGHVNCGINTTP